MKRLVLTGIFLGLAFLVYRGYKVSIFYFPDRLATAYLDSVFDADIRLSKYLETGKENAVDDFFSVLTAPILEAYRKAEQIPRNQKSFELKFKSEAFDKRIYAVTITSLDMKFLLNKVDEYIGYRKNINGKIVKVPGKYPNMTEEEAFMLVRKNENVPVFTKILPLEIVKKNNMWFVGDTEEIWYFLHPDLEQYRTITPK